MGPIFEGEHIRTRSPCLIKVFDVRHKRDSHRMRSAQRWLREAASAARLSHPNIAGVVDHGETPDGTCFVASEQVEGTTLSEAIEANGSLPSHIVVGISKQICMALGEAHAVGVVHRDLNPANVLLAGRMDSEQTVKVVNFGLAIDTHEFDGGDDPQLGPILGSPHYMAPEQVKGASIDGRADIYALGAMMYAMLEGVPPFDRATDLATMMAQVSDFPAPIRATVPRSLARIVMRCLSKRPEQRYASAGDLLAELQCLRIKGDDQGRISRVNSIIKRCSISSSIPWLDPRIYVTIVLVLIVLNIALLAKRWSAPIQPVGSPVIHPMSHGTNSHLK